MPLSSSRLCISGTSDMCTAAEGWHRALNTRQFKSVGCCRANTVNILHTFTAVIFNVLQDIAFSPLLPHVLLSKQLHIDASRGAQIPGAELVWRLNFLT